VSKVLHHRLGQMGAKFGRHAKFLVLALRNTSIPVFDTRFALWVFILISPRGHGVGVIGDGG
jgi:hypothetical protein